MIATVVSVAASLAVGFLLGGCTGRDELSQSLLHRNAELESQVMSQTNVTTGLSAVLIMTACGFAASLLWRAKKGDTHGPTTKRKTTPP
jgi:hypothetical protein